MTEPSAVMSEPTPFDGTLEQIRGRIDTVLRSLPEGSADARRRLTRELEIDPRPEELQSIFRIAQQTVDPALRELALTALALHILAERSLRELFDPPQLSAAAIARSARLVAGLLGTTDKLEAEVQSRAEGLGPRDREYLLEVVDALRPSAEPLIAAKVVAPRLLALVHAAEQGVAPATLPGVSESELALVRDAVSPTPRAGHGVGRIAVGGLALRSVIEDDMAAWKQLAGAADADAVRREAVLAALRLDRTAYRYVSRRLQERQDAALVAGLQDFAEEIRRLQRDLFASYLKLAPVLNAGPDAGKSAGAATPDGAAADLDRLLRACSISERMADADRREKAAGEEQIVRALKKAGGTEIHVRELPATQVARERRRLQILAAVAITLALACVVLYAKRLGHGKLDLNVAPEELGVSLQLIGATSVGPLMHAQMSHFAWEDLSEADRRKGVEQLGMAALSRGHVTVYLADENGRQLAIWTQLGGADLRPAAPARAG